MLLRVLTSVVIGSTVQFLSRLNLSATNGWRIVEGVAILRTIGEEINVPPMKNRIPQDDYLKSCGSAYPILKCHHYRDVYPLPDKELKG